MLKITIGLFFSGLLFGCGPCIASCGPILISYTAGTTKNILRSLMVYILFSLSRITAYIILALIIFFSGRFTLERLVGGYSKYIFILGGGFIVLIGLLMVLDKKIKFVFWQFLRKNILERDEKSIVILGLIIGLLPCAPLLAMLSYVGLISKSWGNSLLYSFSFGLGTFLSPLILLITLTGLIPRFLMDKKAICSRIFNIICGMIIIFLGIQLLLRAR